MAPSEYIKFQSNGVASYAPVGPLAIQCDMDVIYFPFDQHLCDITFESMRYTAEQQTLLVTPQALKLGGERGPIFNDHWFIEPVAPINGSIVDAFGSSFSQVTFQISLKRRSEFFIVALILPLVSISFVEGSIFILPNDSIEKLQLSFASLLAISFFSSMMTDELPHKSRRMPILLVIINLYTAVIALVTIIEALSIYFARKKDKHSLHSVVYIAKCLNNGAILFFSLSITAGTVLIFLVLPFI